jgi:hypothetical protein
VRVVVALDRRLDERRGRDRHLHVVAGEELDLVDRDEVRGVGHRDRKRRAHEPDRDEVVLHHQRLRDDVQDLARDVERERVHDRQAVLALEIGEELLFAHVAELDEVGGEGPALLALLLERAGKLLGGDVAALLEEVAQP